MLPKHLVIAYQADLLVASTQQILSLLSAQDENFVQLESLRSVHIGGSVAYAPLQARIRLLICPNVYCGYGSTEGGTVAYAPAETIFGMDRAVGITAPWIDVEVIDETKAVVDPDGRARSGSARGARAIAIARQSASQYAVDNGE